MGQSLQTAGIFLVQTLFDLYILIVMLRFLFQVVRADFYNPISQFIVKATNPIIAPLRRLIPSIGGLDIATLALALVIKMIEVYLILLIAGFGLQNIVSVLLWSLTGLLSLILNIYLFAIFISVILSWIAPQTYNPAVLLIHQLIEPLMAPIRERLPAMSGIDLSPLVALLILKLVDILIIGQLAQLVGVPQGLFLLL